MNEHAPAYEAGRIRAMAEDSELVERMSNFVPLGFVTGKDPYTNTHEAARAFLIGLAEYLDETP